MKIKKSILELKKFWVSESHLAVISALEEEDVQDIPLDIDFEILIGDELFKLVLQLEGNKGKNKKIGYSFKIVAEGIFGFTKEMEREDIERFLLFSALPMMIANTRGYLNVLTMYAPLGQYILPSVDMTDLVEQKTKKSNSESNK